MKSLTLSSFESLKKLSKIQIFALILLITATLSLATIAFNTSKSAEAATSRPAGTYALFDLINPSTKVHFYTAFKCERDYALNHGYTSRVVAAYVYRPSSLPPVCSSSSSD